MDMEAFVKKQQDQKTERYRATAEIWLTDLCSFMDREVTRSEWWSVFNSLLTKAVEFWKQLEK